MNQQNLSVHNGTLVINLSDEGENVGRILIYTGQSATNDMYGTPGIDIRVEREDESATGPVTLTVP